MKHSALRIENILKSSRNFDGKNPLILAVVGASQNWIFFPDLEHLAKGCEKTKDP